MSMAVRLCKMLERLMRKNESASVNSNDDTVFDIKINASTLSEFYDDLEALVPSLKLRPAKRVKPMLMALAAFIKQVMAGRQYYPLEDVECRLFVESDIESSYATFTFSGIGYFWCDEDDTDEIREENFGEALEPFRNWNKFMGKYSKHIVDSIDDWDIYDKSFSFEVSGQVK